MPIKESKIESNCSFFVSFCPKYRRSVLIDGVDHRLEELIRQTCQNNDIRLDAISIQPDRVFLLLQVDPKLGIHRAVKRIKAESSSALRQEFGWLRSRLPTLWTNSYFVQSVGILDTKVLDKYLEEQKNV